MSEEVLIALDDLVIGSSNHYKTLGIVIKKRRIIKNYIEQLQQENQQLKEQLVNLYQEFKLNHVSTATEYQMICMKDEIHKKEVEQLKERLQQRDEVIDEALEIINCRLKENNNHVNARMEMFHYNNLKTILTKYKGDNNGNK